MPSSPFCEYTRRSYARRSPGGTQAARAQRPAGRPPPATGPRGPPTPGSAKLASLASAQARVVGDLVPDQQGVRRLWQVVERAGPRVQVDALLLVQLPQAVVK